MVSLLLILSFPVLSWYFAPLLLLLLMNSSARFLDMDALWQSKSDGTTAFYSAVELLVAKSVLVTERFLLWLLLGAESLSAAASSGGESKVMYGMIQRSKQDTVPENKDDGESDEDEDGNDPEDDDVSGEQNYNEGDEEDDDPETNGGGSEEEDDEGNDDDDDNDGGDDDDDDEDEEEEEDDEEDEELQQPPTKKKK